MKKITYSIAVILTSAMMILSSCSSTKKTSNQDKGVAIGAVGGAILGGVIGNNVGNKNNTALGAILGAAVGGVAGGLIGKSMDKQAAKIKAEIPGAQVIRVGEGIDVTFSEPNPDGSKAGIYFQTNEYEINSNSQLSLDKLQKIFAEYLYTNILIEGHTDDVGSENYNLRLSVRRANSTGNYLMNAGITSTRLTIKGYGESQPKVTNSTEANRTLNRRVQFIITANETMKESALYEAQKN